MQLRLVLSIALTHLRSRSKQTIVAGLGVAFGIAFFISLLSFMTGINDLLDGLMMRTVPHVTLSSEPNLGPRIIDEHPDFLNSHNFIRSVKPRGKIGKIRNGSQVLSSLRKDKDVVGAIPRLNAGVFFLNGAQEINGMVKGVRMDEEVALFGLDANVIEGNWRALLKVPNGIILGKDLATSLGVEVGKQVVITASSGNSRIMKVVGLFQMGVREVDATVAYISIVSAQNFLGHPSDYYTEIGVQLRDINRAQFKANQFQTRYQTKALDYLSTNAQLETGSSVRTIISYAVGITLLLVAGFGIYNILNVMIFEKMNDIAILKATGFSSRDVGAIFISQAMIIGILGGIAGLIMGFGLSVLISYMPFETPALPTIKTFPVNFNPFYYVLCMGFALITTFLAGYLPSRKASKIDPVEIIRNQ